MALVVQKYGGTSVANLDKIANVAKKVIRTKEEGNDVVVVLSAMSGETDRLRTSPIPGSTIPWSPRASR
jgi:aspartate kinase